MGLQKSNHWFIVFILIINTNNCSAIPKKPTKIKHKAELQLIATYRLLTKDDRALWPLTILFDCIGDHIHSWISFLKIVNIHMNSEKCYHHGNFAFIFVWIFLQYDEVARLLFALFYLIRCNGHHIMRLFLHPAELTDGYMYGIWGTTLCPLW